MGRSPRDISLLILTHSHPFDHIWAAESVVEASGCKVAAAHEMEVSWIEDVDLQARQRPAPGLQSLVEGSVKVDRPLKEGDLLELSGLSLKVIHTPGNSKGSIPLLLQEDCVLITGDAVPVKGELPIYNDALKSGRSIEKLKALEGIQVLLSAWDEPREGSQIERIMAEGQKYISRIHKAVLKVSNGFH